MPSAALKPLSKIKILDLSRLLPGPYCSYLLAQQGAQVTWVAAPRDELQAFNFEVLRTRQKKIILDLKNEKDLNLLKKRIFQADIVIEGFRPHALERLGIGFSILKKINPHLILCSIQGYAGSKAAYAAHDLNFQAASGFLSALFFPHRPQVPGVPIGDLIGGTRAAFEILGHLQIPKTKRKAVHLKISITDALKDFFTPTHARLKEMQQPVFEQATARYHLYQTQDHRYLAVAAIEERFWTKLLTHFKIPAATLKKGDSELRKWLEKEFKTKPLQDWLELLCDPDLCVSEVV